MDHGVVALDAEDEGSVLERIMYLTHADMAQRQLIYITYTSREQTSSQEPSWLASSSQL